MNKVFGILVSTLIAVTLIVWINTASSSVANDYQTDLITSADSNHWMTVDGTLQSQDFRKLFSQESGLVSKIHVDSGDIVKKGDVLAELDEPGLLLQSLKKLEVVERELSNAFNPSSKLQQIKRGEKSGFYTSSETVKAQADLMKEMNDYSQFLVSMESIRKSARGRILIAPFDGIIASVSWKVGDLININHQNAPGITVLPEAPRWYVEIQIPPYLMQSVKRKMEAKIDWPFSTKTVSGDLVKVAVYPTQNPTTEKFAYTGRVEVNPSDMKSDEMLVVDQPLRVHLNLKKVSPDVSWVPKKAFGIQIPDQQVQQEVNLVPDLQKNVSLTDENVKKMKTNQVSKRTKITNQNSYAQQYSFPKDRTGYFYLINDHGQIQKVTVRMMEESDQWVAVADESLVGKSVITKVLPKTGSLRSIISNSL